MLPQNRSSAGAPAGRLGSVASVTLVAAFGVSVYTACASSTTSGGPTSTPDSGATTSSSSGSGSSSGEGYDAGGTTSSSSSSSGATTTSSSSGTSTSTSSSGSTATCYPPQANTATLPFAVDSQYIASGYEGDTKLILQSTDKTCGGARAMAPNVGTCHTFTYDYGGDGGAGDGWAGVVWQYPTNNWGSSAGYLIPPGATQVTFYAKGMVGGEMVGFGAGGLGGGGDACQDTVTGTLATSPVALTTTWTQYTLTLGPTGGATSVTYTNGVIGGFGWNAAGSSQAGAGGSITFYIDNIEWTM